MRWQWLPAARRTLDVCGAFCAVRILCRRTPCHRTPCRKTLSSLPWAEGRRRLCPQSSLLLFLFLAFWSSFLLPVQAEAAKAPQNLQRLITEFNELDNNPARGARRDLWLALEGKFALLATKSKGDAKALASLYQARSMQELGRRSFLPADHRKAVALFAAVAAKFPKHSAASESLYRQADILVHRLGDRDAAVRVLEDLLARYPKAPEKNAAGTLLKQAKAAPKEPAVADSKPGAGKKTAASGQGQAPAGSKKGGDSVMEQLGLTVRTIMLDAGHGGNDPGAQAAGVTEKAFTLAMANRVGDLLKKQGFIVLYTRTGDKYISLQDRPDMANSRKADLFISLHVNANPKSGVRGLETYYLDEAKTQDAITVAARENGVSVKNISDLQFILTDLMLSSKVRESHHLADCVHKGILTRLRSTKHAAHDNGVRSAPFYVLVGARMPAILVEFGYITNNSDAANLKKEAYLQRQAEGLVQGVLRYKAELARGVTRPR